MEFENLQLNVDQGNTLEISPETKFLASKISIVGSGCKVHIEKALI